jgi:hypothetical protein
MVNLAILLRQSKDFGSARRLLEEAAPHHKTALDANPGNLIFRRYFRNNRRVLAETLADLGEHTAAANTADDWIQAAVDPADDLYNAACIFARCIPLAERDNKERAQAYADRAVATLRQAVKNGYKDVAHMKKDTDLDPLRSHPEFQKLLKELENATPANHAGPSPLLMPPRPQ